MQNLIILQDLQSKATAKYERISLLNIESFKQKN